MPRLHPVCIALGASLVLAHGAAAQALNRVNVSAPQINCVFSTSCSVTVNDLVTPYLGNGFLQSRTFQAQPGAPAAGKWVYEYRLDMTNVTGSPAPTVVAIAMPVAEAPVSMDFDGDGSATDQVFIVTGGGLGVVGPSSAWLHGDTLHFNFSPPVSGGASAGTGQSSYFFGFVANTAPRTVGARVSAPADSSVWLEAHGPDWPASGAAASPDSRKRVPPSRPQAPRPRRP